MTRHQLTDEEWECIADVFPAPAKTGRPPRDQRAIVDAILWIVRTGSPWRDLPEEYQPWATVWDLFDKWNSDGTLDEILRRVRAMRLDAGEIDEELWCIVCAGVATGRRANQFFIMPRNCRSLRGR